jgi:hypothetical protein
MQSRKSEGKDSQKLKQKNIVVLFAVILSASINANAKSCHIPQYSKAIVLTEENHILSAYAIQIKTPQASPQTLSATPQIITTNYDGLAMVQEKSTPILIEPKNCRTDTSSSYDFIIK